MKKNNFYFFLLLSTFSKIISNENFSILNQYKENISSFKSIIKKDIDTTKEENIKKFHAALESIEINTNAFFEADSVNQLNDFQLDAFRKYIEELRLLKYPILKKFFDHKFCDTIQISFSSKRCSS